MQFLFLFLISFLQRQLHRLTKVVSIHRSQLLLNKLDRLFKSIANSLVFKYSAWFESMNFSRRVNRTFYISLSCKPSIRYSVVKKINLAKQLIVC